MKSTISSKILESFLIRTNDPQRKLYQHRIMVLILTFLTYTIYHMSRKPMSVVKSKLFNGNITDENNWPPFNGNNANGLLSALDFAYWGTYAVGMFAAGYVAERSELRYFLTTSLLLCGVMNIISGMAYYLEIHSLGFFITTQVLTGLIESTGWPAVLAIIGGWFGSTKKGLIFGIWSLHTSTGNILGSALAGAFVDHSWGLSFIVPGIICIVFAIIVFVLLVSKPSDVDLKVDMALPEDDIINDDNDAIRKNSDPEKNDDNNINDNDNNDAISLWGALKIPGVVEFSLCLFFTKSVSYIFLNWLPKFISSIDNISPSQAAYISIMFDVGGSVGSIMAGFMSDFTNAGGTTCVIFLLMAIPSLFLMGNFSHLGLIINLILQFMAGFFANGPYSLITTAVSANLACKVPSKAATATVSAIIDGTGSIGAAIGPAITGPIYDNFNWNSVFYICMLGDFIAAACLMRIAFDEVKRKWSRTSSSTAATASIIRRESESSTQSEITNDDTKTIVPIP